MRIALVGNCQVVSLRDLFNRVLPEHEVVEIEVWKLKGAQFDDAAAVAQQCDLILAQPIFSSYFGALEKESLKRIAADGDKRIVFFHNLAFGGIVPDCIFVGPIGKRLKGPTSDYHSSIVLASFLGGATESECTMALLAGHGVDLELIWKNSVNELITRETFVDVPFADELVKIVVEVDSFHYFNHPMPNLIGRYGEKLIRASLGVSVDCAGVELPDLLLQYGSWPIYEWVSDFFGLAYSRNHFNKASGLGQMPLREFVDRSYDIYSSTDRAVLEFKS